MESEDIYRQINENLYVIRVISKPADNGRSQYRFFLICNHCKTRTRISNGNADITHDCSLRNQKLIDNFGIGINHSTFIQARFVAQMNLSMSHGTSQYFYDFCKEIFETGQKSILRLIPDNIKKTITIPTFKEFSKCLARTQFTKEFVSIAEFVRNNSMSVFKSMEYVSFCIDAGTINGIPILDILLTNPFSKCNPAIWAARTHFQGTTNDYKTALKKNNEQNYKI